MRTAIAALVSSSLVAFLPACGKARLPGGGDVGDADGGGNPDGTSFGPVAVTVLSFDGTRTPREGVPVGFFDADGAHQATVETGSDGVASSELEAGGTVVAFVGTLVPNGVAALNAFAVLGVKPGDQIAIGGEPFLAGNEVTPMQFNLPAVTGASNYELYTSCGPFFSGTSTVAANFREECQADTVSFVAATVGSDGIRQFLREEDVPVVASYDAMASWQMMPTRPFLFTGLPEESMNLQAGIYAVRAGDDQMDSFLLRDSAAVAEDMVTVRPERIPNYDATLVWSEIAAEQPALGAFDLYRWLGPDDETDADVGALVLPWMSPISYDNTTRSLRWRIIGDQEYDATYLTFIASANVADTFVETVWNIAAPPGIEEIVMPEMSEDQAAFFLSDPDFVNAYGQIVESNQLDGYDGARQLGFDPSYVPRLDPLGSVVRKSFSGSVVR